MSDLSAIMDAIVTAAETVSNVTAQRVLRYADEISAEDFPFCCIYDPDEVSELAEFQLTTKTTTISVLLFTKGETQDALLTKMGAFRDAIAADRTLGGIVQFAHVATRSISEDNRPSETEPMRAALMTVETVEQTGKIISIEINAELVATPGFTDWAALDATLNTFVLDHIGGARLSSNLVTDQDTIAVGVWRYQIAWTVTEHQKHGSNGFKYLVSCSVKAHYHIAAATSEATLISGTLMGKIDGLLDKANWRALAGIHEVVEDTTPIIALDDLERVN